MTINDLYDLADEKGHEIVYTNIPQTKSVAIYDSGKCTIGMDNGLHGQEETEHLAHELGHCETGTFYGCDTDPTTRMRCEFKANRWAYGHLVPFDELMKAIRSGCHTVWELADQFNLRPETMQKIIFSYFGE